MIITKVAEIITSPKNIPKFQRLSGLLYILAILLVLCLPYFSEKDGIIEKMLRNSDSFGTNYSINSFEKHANDFLQHLQKLLNEDKYTSKHSIVQRLFENVNVNKDIFELENERVFSFHIPSIVNDKNKYNLITFIYDSESSMMVTKNLYIVYNLLKYFENKDNYRWISKDLKILLISKELYYNKPKSLINIINNSPYFTETKLDFAINMELDDDLHDAENLILGICGKNAENIDLDFYKLVSDNLSHNFLDNMKTFDDYLSEDTKSMLEYFFRTLDDTFVRALASQFSNKPHVQYDRYFIYFLENLIDTFFKPRPLDFNHLLISENYNSLSIRSSGAALTRNELLEDKHFFYNYKRKIAKNYQFFEALERILKGINMVEIQIFRGNYNYFPTSPNSYIALDFVFMIPLLAGIHIAYKVLDNLQKLKFEHVNKSKICSLSTLMFSLFLFLFLDIENFSSMLKKIDYPIEEYYIFIIILIFCYVTNVIVFRQLIKLNKSEFKFFETIKMFLVAIFSYNIFMINYGIGLMTCLSLYSFESIYANLNKKYLKTKQKIFVCMKLIPDALFFYMAFAEYDEYFYTITHNYINYFNHTYPLFCLFYVLSSFNLACSAISIQDKFVPVSEKNIEKKKLAE